MTTCFDVLVQRSDLRQIDIRPRDGAPEPRPGQVLLLIDRFALGANNLTYGTLGDSNGFWQFFPAEPPWGRLPAWGFADVEASRHEAIAVGDRVFGLLPMSSHLLVEPGRITGHGFVDETAHRSALFSTYNAYARWPAGSAPPTQGDDLYAALRPLFFTSFVLDDWLADQRFFGARTVWLSSASSKTALGTAFLLRERTGVEVVGLTSARHVDFVAATGCFDRVHAYEDLAGMAPAAPVVYVDFSGDAALRQTVHARAGTALVRSLRVGATHRSTPTETSALPGVAPQTFFGPAQIRKRRTEWGASVLQARHDAAMARFADAAAAWLVIGHCDGVAAFESAYRRVTDGAADPSRALVVRWAEPSDEAPLTPEERAALALVRTPSRR